MPCEAIPREIIPAPGGQHKTAISTDPSPGFVAVPLTGAVPVIPERVSVARLTCAAGPTRQAEWGATAVFRGV